MKPSGSSGSAAGTFIHLAVPFSLVDRVESHVAYLFLDEATAALNPMLPVLKLNHLYSAKMPGKSGG